MLPTSSYVFGCASGFKYARDFVMFTSGEGKIPNPLLSGRGSVVGQFIGGGSVWRRARRLPRRLPAIGYRRIHL